MASPLICQDRTENGTVLAKKFYSMATLYCFRYGIDIHCIREGNMSDTYRRRLYDVALDQYGYVTTVDAKRLGVPPGDLRKIAQRGGVTRVSQGLYRFDDVPRTERDAAMAAVLAVGDDAFLTGDAVLAMHGLGYVHPREIRVGTRRRVRRRTLPRGVTVVSVRIEENDLTAFEGIPSTTIERAIRDSADVVMPDRLAEAVKQAAERGLIPRERAGRLLSELAAQ